jgi:ABC-type sugar transport system permease subunit
VSEAGQQRAARPVWVGLTVFGLVLVQAVVTGVLLQSRRVHVAAKAATMAASDLAGDLARGEAPAELSPSLRPARLAGGEPDAFGIVRGVTLTETSHQGWPSDPEPLLEQARGMKDAKAGDERLLEADGYRVVLTPALAGGVVVAGAMPQAPDLSLFWLLAIALAVAAAASSTMLTGQARWITAAAVFGVVAIGVWQSMVPLDPAISEDLLVRQAAVPVGAFCGVLAGFYVLIFRGTLRVVRGVVAEPTGYLYVTPAMLGMLICVFVPFAMGVGIAFFTTEGDFVGLSNFDEILLPSATADVDFYKTLLVTILWTLLNVVLHVALGLTLALALNRPLMRLRAIYRILLILPWAVPNYITALIWKGMFNFQYGAINVLLRAVGVDPVVWLGEGGSFATNFTANLVTNTWLGFPFMMVVSLGALQSIPSDLYEAASIDGASRWQRFKHITAPLLRPALFPAIILGSIWTFNMFNVIYLVSNGAPSNTTNILITEAYRAFAVLQRHGLAAAYSLFIFVILLAYTLWTGKITGSTKGLMDG